MKRLITSGLTPYANRLGLDLGPLALAFEAPIQVPAGLDDSQAVPAPARGVAHPTLRHGTLCQPNHPSLRFRRQPHPSASPTGRAGAGTAACGLDSVPGTRPNRFPDARAQLGLRAARDVGACLVIATMLLFAPPKASAGQDIVTTLPQTPIHGCRGGKARLYNECHAQQPIFDKALREARKGQGKTLLVSYGAEWCIWCHVFHAYVTGEHGSFTHPYSDADDTERYSATIHERAESDPAGPAAGLAAFVAENFVLVHIDSRYADDGWDVLDAAGATQGYGNRLPYIFTVDPSGRFAAAMVHDRVQTRRDTDDWFRGYDRDRLTAELSRMQEAAR